VSVDSKCVLGSASIAEQLKYKYIISLEGNDVGSSLKWVLLSQSVAFMKKPAVER